MTIFDISGLIAQRGASALGKTLSVTNITVSSTNERGDETPTATAYSIDGMVDIVTTEDDEVKEGILETGDLIIWFDENATNIAYVKNENQITYQGTMYRITNTIKNIGHYEVHCKKL